MVADGREHRHVRVIQQVGEGVIIGQPPAVRHVAVRHDEERLKLIRGLHHLFEMAKHAMHVADKQKIEFLVAARIRDENFLAAMPGHVAQQRSFGAQKLADSPVRAFDRHLLPAHVFKKQRDRRVILRGGWAKNRDFSLEAERANDRDLIFE